VRSNVADLNHHRTVCTASTLGVRCRRARALPPEPWTGLCERGRRCDNWWWQEAGGGTESVPVPAPPRRRGRCEEPAFRQQRRASSRPPVRTAHPPTASSDSGRGSGSRCARPRGQHGAGPVATAAPRSLTRKEHLCLGDVRPRQRTFGWHFSNTALVTVRVPNLWRQFHRPYQPRGQIPQGPVTLPWDSHMVTARWPPARISLQLSRPRSLFHIPCLPRDPPSASAAIPRPDRLPPVHPARSSPERACA